MRLWVAVIPLVAVAGSQAARITAPWLGYCNARFLEKSEFLARLHPALFWDSLQHPLNEKLDDHDKKLLDLALKYRLFSARIAVHESLFPRDAPDCDTFAVVDEQFYCNQENLAGKLKDSTLPSEDAQADARASYGIRLGKGSKIVYLYSLGTGVGTGSKLAAFVRILRPLAERNDISLIYRHIVKRDCSNDKSTSLPGFGLELDIKEYGTGSETVQSPFGRIQLAAPSSGDDFGPLGVNLVQAILDAKDSLEAFSFAAENSPLLMQHLSKSRGASDDVVAKVSTLAQHFNLPENMVSLNGFEVTPPNLNLHTLTEFLIDYKSLITRYLSTSFRPSPTTPPHFVAQKIMTSALTPQVIRFDVRNAALMFLNDLERDARYAFWPRALQTLLRPARGHFYPLARNLVLLTLVIDIDHIPVKTIQGVGNIVAQMVPLQASFVLHSTASDKDHLAAYYAIFRKLGSAALLDFMYHQEKESGATTTIYEFFDRIPGNLPLKQLITKTDAAELVEAAQSFAGQIGAGQETLLFLNGRIINYTEGMWQRDVIKFYQEEIYNIQMALLAGDIDESTDYLKLLLDDEATFKSRHPLTFAESVKAGRFLEGIPAKLRYISMGSKDSSSLTTVIFIGDLERSVDRTLLLQWLRHLETDEQHSIRFSIIPSCLHFPSKMDAVVEAVMAGEAEVSALIDSIVGGGSSKSGAKEERPRPEWCMEMRNQRHHLGADISTGPLVAINGQLFGPLTEETLLGINIVAWLQFEAHHRSGRILRLLRDLKGTDAIEHDSVVAACVYEGHLMRMLSERAYLVSGSPAMEIPLEKVVHFTVPTESPLVSMQFLLNPFSPGAAKFSALLLEMRGLLDASIVINVLPKYVDNPATSLYRFQGLNGDIEPMLSETRYALMFNVPAAWDLVEASDDADLDNLHFKRDGRTPRPTVEIKGLAVDVETRAGTDGSVLSSVPLELCTREGALIDRAVSTSATGSAHLRAAPGIYDVLLPKNEALRLLVPSAVVLDSITVNVGQAPLHIEDPVRVRKEPLSVLFAPPKTGRASTNPIHVFTIVSGAVYERLVRIMMVSVVRNTRTPVKFWIIGNFVTPAFERSLKRVATHYNFTYEFIRPRWPSWLNPQLRKHRRVWAHKILFLDVFPHEVDRLIYVDADQVMRGNIKELASIDLEERVYGFVPFCKSRKETAALRFWEEGYWADHLRGLPYHISALFVVDMLALRRQNVADRLRIQYQMLSYDPKSLANLDQDLPNNLQHEVPIYPLPAEWLWCETWCDDASKRKAKSIDLCSNPLRNEGKLEQAKRIIPEWTKYDREISELLLDELEATSSSDSHDEL